MLYDIRTCLKYVCFVFKTLFIGNLEFKSASDARDCGITERVSNWFHHENPRKSKPLKSSINRLLVFTYQMKIELDPRKALVMSIKRHQVPEKGKYCMIMALMLCFDTVTFLKEHFNEKQFLCSTKKVTRIRNEASMKTDETHGG